MDQKLETLIGFHDKDFTESIENFLSSNKCNVHSVDTVKEMMEYLKKKEYTYVFMDLNLGKPADLDITPAKQVYDYLKDKIEEGKVIFYGLSARMSVVEKAKKDGIPAVHKYDFPDLKIFN